jgi:hypothetical protein
MLQFVRAFIELPAAEWTGYPSQRTRINNALAGPEVQ